MIRKLSKFRCQLIYCQVGKNNEIQLSGIFLFELLKTFEMNLSGNGAVGDGHQMLGFRQQLEDQINGCALIDGFRNTGNVGHAAQHFRGITVDSQENDGDIGEKLVMIGCHEREGVIIDGDDQIQRGVFVFAGVHGDQAGKDFFGGISFGVHVFDKNFGPDGAFAESGVDPLDDVF